MINWRKSSFSGTEGNCVEVAQMPVRVLVQDSKNTGGPRLAVTMTGWRALLAAL